MGLLLLVVLPGVFPWLIPFWIGALFTAVLSPCAWKSWRAVDVRLSLLYVPLFVFLCQVLVWWGLHPWRCGDVSLDLLYSSRWAQQTHVPASVNGIMCDAYGQFVFKEQPEYVASPRTVAHLVDAMEWAVGHNVTIWPWGQGMFLQSIAKEHEVLRLDTSRLRYQPKSTNCVDGGDTLTQIWKRTRIALPGPARATIGGCLAVGCTSPGYSIQQFVTMVDYVSIGMDEITATVHQNVSINQLTVGNGSRWIPSIETKSTIVTRVCLIDSFPQRWKRTKYYAPGLSETKGAYQLMTEMSLNTSQEFIWVPQTEPWVLSWTPVEDSDNVIDHTLGRQYDWQHVPAWTISPFTVSIASHTILSQHRFPTLEIAAPGWLRYVWHMPPYVDMIPLVQQQITDLLFTDKAVPFWVVMRVAWDANKEMWRLILQFPLGTPGVKDFVMDVDTFIHMLYGTMARESMTVNNMPGRWEEAAWYRSQLSIVILFLLISQSIWTFWWLGATYTRKFAQHMIQMYEIESDSESETESENEIE